MKGNREKAVCKPGKDILPETEFSGTLILDFWPPEVWENKFLLSKPSSMWYTVMATQAPHLVCYYILCCVIAYYLLYFLLREKKKKTKMETRNISSPKWILPFILPSIKTPLCFSFPSLWYQLLWDTELLVRWLFGRQEIKIKRNKT